jgi:serine/threonine protein phosphatase PrpC
MENLYLMAVADGHGVNGHLVSKHIKKILASVLEFEDKRLT